MDKITVTSPLLPNLDEFHQLLHNSFSTNFNLKSHIHHV